MHTHTHTSYFALLILNLVSIYILYIYIYAREREIIYIYIERKERDEQREAHYRRAGNIFVIKRNIYEFYLLSWMIEFTCPVYTCYNQHFINVWNFSVNNPLILD